MDGGHHSGIERDGDDVTVGTAEFVYVPGRTLYMMPFTDAEEEEAWDRAMEARGQ